MGTNAKSDPSWIDRLKTRGVLALSTVAAALGVGLSNMSPPTPAPTPTPPPRAAEAQDPVSPDGHYATWSAYLDSITCNLERYGYAPKAICSPIFTAAASPQTPTPNPPLSTRADQRQSSNNSAPKNEGHNPQAKFDEVRKKFDEAMAKTRSIDPHIRLKGYLEVENIILPQSILNTPEAAAERAYGIGLFGNKAQFYEQLDLAAKSVTEITDAKIQEVYDQGKAKGNTAKENCNARDLLQVKLDALSIRTRLLTTDYSNGTLLNGNIDYAKISSEITRTRKQLYSLYSCPTPAPNPS